MATGTERGVVGAMHFDLKKLHETWMELVFPRQRDAENTALGKWKPKDTGSRIAYRAWSILGMPVIALLYPLALLGVIVRFQARRLDSTATRLGVAGVAGLAIVVWGALTAVARFQLALAAGGFIAIAAASAVAVISATLAAATRKVGGRAITVVLSYPFAMTAIFLPPVVAALYSQTFASVVIPQSDSIARWLLWNVFDVAGIAQFLVENFDRQGLAYVGMWFGIAVPLGWLLGIMVTLADFVKPT